MSIYEIKNTLTTEEPVQLSTEPMSSMEIKDKVDDLLWWSKIPLFKSEEKKKDPLKDIKDVAKQYETQALFYAREANETLIKIYTLIAFMVATATTTGVVVSDRITRVLADVTERVELTDNDIAEIARSAIDITTDEGIEKIFRVIQIVNGAIATATDLVSEVTRLLSIIKVTSDIDTAKDILNDLEKTVEAGIAVTGAISDAFYSIKSDVNGKVLSRVPRWVSTLATIKFSEFNIDPMKLLTIVKDAITEIIDYLPLKRLVNEKEYWEKILEESEPKYDEFRQERLNNAIDKLKEGPVPIQYTVADSENLYRLCFAINSHSIDDEEKFEAILYSTPSPHHCILELHRFHRPFNGEWGYFCDIKSEFYNHPKIIDMTIKKDIAYAVQSFSKMQKTKAQA